MNYTDKYNRISANYEKYQESRRDDFRSYLCHYGQCKERRLACPGLDMNSGKQVYCRFV